VWKAQSVTNVSGNPLKRQVVHSDSKSKSPNWFGIKPEPNLKLRHPQTPELEKSLLMLSHSCCIAETFIASITVAKADHHA